MVLLHCDNIFGGSSFFGLFNLGNGLLSHVSSLDLEVCLKEWCADFSLALWGNLLALTKSPISNLLASTNTLEYPGEPSYNNFKVSIEVCASSFWFIFFTCMMCLFLLI